MAEPQRPRLIQLNILIPILLAITALMPSASFAQSSAAPIGPTTQTTAGPKIKPDAKKAKNAYQQGLAAEKQQDWQAAFEAYTNAVNWAPNEQSYFLRLELAKSRLVQTKADAAERDAIAGHFDDARRELLEARYLDPTNTVLRDRMAELAAEEPGSVVQSAPDARLAGELHLDYQSGKRKFDYRGDTHGAYEEVAREFGVEVAFDVQLSSRPVNVQLGDVDFPTAMRLLGQATGTFWRPLTSRLFFVTQDTPQKRKDYDVSVVRTVLLPASVTPEEMTETQRLIREIAGITRSDLDAPNRTLTLRASPEAITVATQLIDEIEQPLGELILEIEILDVDKAYASQIGITPPQTLTVYTLSPQQISEAQQGGASLVNVISQVFGLPAALSGLSSAQIASLIASNQLSAASLLPPLIAFGGGETTFLATLPGVMANLSQMLSLVRQGRRILLRAQDGHPTTFFVGERIPVSLALFSSSLGNGTSSSSSPNSTAFPLTNFPAGTTPSFVTNAITRTGSTSADLIVANSGDNDVGVLLGNGDGTFGTQTTFPTGTDPVWIATGNFNSAGGTDTNLDLAVANEGSNSISILLGNGDGTFTPGTAVNTGNSPVSVVAADFRDTLVGSTLDLAVANQGDNSISIFSGNGDGTFSLPRLLPLPSGFMPAALAAADFNKDGHIDLAVADEGTNTVSIFLGNGDGTFQNRTDYAVGASPVWISAADFNADGILDLAVADSGASTATNNGNSVSILLGQVGANGSATGTFAPGTQRDFPAGNQPVSISVGDYNVDGITDLAVVAKTDNSLSVLLGSGGGLFSPNFELPVGTSPVSITTGPFTTSNLSDVAIANSGSNNISVILDTSSFSGTTGGLPGTLFPGAEYLDIGLKVKATPRIHPDNEVTVQLAFDISSLSTQTFNTIPVIDNETVDQTVRLKENETSVLAGILQPQVTNAMTGNPGISSIPGIGRLDQNKSIQDQDTELLILVTPRVVRYEDHKNRVIYAGQGSLDNGAGGGPAPEPAPPVVQAPASTTSPQPGAGGNPSENQQPAAPGALPPLQQPGVPPPGQPQQRVPQQGLPPQTQPQQLPQQQ